MGKTYFCEYCNRSFADWADNRKKHLVSLNHVRLRKTHYDQFKDAATILKEESLKKPCRKFFLDGHCDYGASCKYCHYSSDDFQKLHEIAILEEETGGRPKKVLPDPDLKGWLENVMKNKDKIPESPRNSSESSISSLPEHLRNIPNLPPSMMPATISSASNYPSAEWG